jgi:membrane-associated phospholipid phosphatase
MTKQCLASILFLFGLCCGPLLVAQDRYNLSQFGEETGRFFTQPIRWDGGDWCKLAAVGAGTFFVMQADQPIREILMRNHQYYKSVPIEAGRIWGESYMTPSLAVAFGLHGYLTDNLSTKKFAFELTQSIIYSAVITQIVSKSVGRARPNQELGRSAFQPFTMWGEDFHSLPGGHSSAAFVLSTVISRNVDSGILKALAYLPAAVTIVSRVYQDYHWTSDDVLGAAIGYVVADWVVDQHEQNDSRVAITSFSPLTVRFIIN